MRGILFRIAVVAVLALCLPCAETAAQSPAEPGGFHFEGTAQRLFDQLAGHYRVRILVDPDLRVGRVRLDLEEVPLATALKVANTLTGSFWVWQPDGAILVLEDTAAKRDRYESVELRTFALPGSTSEEITDTLRMLRELIDPPHIALDLRTQTITVRDRPRRLQVVEQLLNQFRTDRAELVVDLLLLQVDSNKARQLGILPPDLAVMVHIGAGVLPTDNALQFLQALRELVNQGVLPPVLLTDRFDLTQGLGVIGLGKGRGQYLVNLPGTSLTLSEVQQVTRSMRLTTLRATDGVEATFFAGELFPIAFTTFSSSFIPREIQDLIDSGQFVPPVPAFQQQELGQTLSLVPSIHGSAEVTLKLSLENTSLAGGSLNDIPVLNNRTVESSVRLRLGESAVISGLRGVERTPTTTGWPLLGRIPWLGRLFSSRKVESRDVEFLVLVTPRLVRLKATETQLARGIYIGREGEFDSRSSRGGSAPRRQLRPQPTAPTNPQAPQPPQIQPQQPQRPPQ